MVPRRDWDSVPSRDAEEMFSLVALVDSAADFPICVHTPASRPADGRM